MIHTDLGRFSVRFLIFLLLVAAWRELSKLPTVQAPLHRVLKTRAVAAQWYTVLFVGLVFFAVASIVILVKDGLVLHVSEKVREENLRDLFKHAHYENKTFEEFEDELGVGAGVTTINMFGQFAGLLVIAISSFHCFVLLIIPSQRKAIHHNDYQSYSWHVPKRVNWLLWILALPAVFSTEVILSNISLWGMVNGLMTVHHEPDYNIEQARRLEYLYEKEDIQIATLFQFTAVYQFTRLTSSLLTDTSLMKGHTDEKSLKAAKDYKRLIRNGGFLGIWLYVIAGIVRAVVVIAICTHLRFTILTKKDVGDSYVQWLEDLEEAFNAEIGLTFTVLTIITVINMWVMTRTAIITEKLGDPSKGEHDANKKFIGVRLMLICSEVIPKVIDFFEVGTPEFKRAEKLIGHVSFLHMSAEQAEILKNAIFSFSCLFAAIMNFFFWRSLDIEQAGLLDFTDVERNRQNSKATLISPTSSSSGSSSVDSDSESFPIAS